jgi:hypothetical protein
VAFDGRESVQLLRVSSSALFRSGSVPNNKKLFQILIGFHADADTDPDQDPGFS